MATVGIKGLNANGYTALTWKYIDLSTYREGEPTVIVQI